MKHINLKFRSDANGRHGSINVMSLCNVSRFKHEDDTKTTRTRHELGLYLHRYVATLLVLLMAGFGQAWGTDTQILVSNFNTISGDSVGRFVKGGCTSISRTNDARTGSYALSSIYTGSNSEKLMNSYTIASYTANDYMHVIAYAKVNANSSNTITKAWNACINAYLNGNNKGDTIGLSKTTWRRMTASKSYKSNLSNKPYVGIYRKADNKADSVLIDDVIAYFSTKSSIDLTAPSTPSSPSATASTISWTRARDGGGSSDSTGVQATLIWKRISGSSDDLSVNQNGVYTIGDKDNTGHWQLVEERAVAYSTSSAALVEDTRYALVHRDLAYNMSTAAYVSTPAAASDHWYIYGNFSDGETWTDTEVAMNGNVDINIPMDAHDYAFKIKHTNGASTWYSGVGDGSYMSRDNHTSWYFNNTYNCGLRTDIGGTYNFALTLDGETPVVTVTYPTGVAVTLDYNYNSLSYSWQAKSGYTIPIPDFSPSRDGYAFDGWYADAEGTEPWLWGTTVNSATTLYAKWSHAFYYKDAWIDSWADKLMSRSTLGSYWYYEVDRNGDNRVFCIQSNGNYYKCGNTASGYMCTDITNMNGTNNNWGIADGNCAVNYNTNQKYYILVFPGNTAANTTNSPKICASTTLPEEFYAVESGINIYFDNSEVEWSNVYFRKGRSCHNEASLMSKVTGTDNLYKLTVASDYNGYQAFHIANNSSWTDDNSIYKVDGTDYEITEAIEFQKYALDEDMTFTPGDEGDEDDGCQYYVGHRTYGMKKDNVSITAPTNGSISVTYTSGSGGTLTSGNADLAHTSILTISASGATGYDLDELTVNEVEHTSGEDYVLSEDAVVAATFTPQVYTINYYDLGGGAFSGSHADGHPTTHTYATATTLKGATKSNYTWGGWYTNSSCTGEAVASLGATAYTSSPNLYGKFTQTITLDSEGGSSGSSSTTAIYNSTTLTSITNPTKTGYTFGGWYDGDDGTGNLVISTSGVLQDNVTGYTGAGGIWTSGSARTLYAKWTVNNYTLAWDKNGGDALTGDYTTGSTAYNSSLTPPNTPTRSGYRFVKWNTKSGGDGDDYTGTMPAANTTYYAQWVQTYTITTGSHTNGSITIETSPAAAGDEITITASADDGYAFDAWTIKKTSDASDITSSVSLSSSSTSPATFTMPAYGVTVDAAFEESVTTYSLSYSIGTGATGAASGGTAAGSYTEGTTITVPTQGTLANEGYTFRGWTDGTTFYTAGQSFSMPASDVTVSAVWDENAAGSCEIVNIDFTDETTTSLTAGGETKTVDGVDVYFKGIASITNGSGAVPSGNMSSNNYYIAIPLSGINSSISFTITGANRPQLRYQIIQYDALPGSIADPNGYTGIDRPASGSSVTVSNVSVSKSYAVLYIGQSSSSNPIGTVSVTTSCTVSSGYKVTFDKGSGPSTVTGMPSKIEGVTSGLKILEPDEIPTATGYTFDKWVTTSGGSTPFSFSGAITKDTTIYAKWTANTYSVAVTLTDSKATQESGDTGAGAATYGEDYVATFEAVSGYTLPSDVTVSIDGDTKEKDTEYTWSVSDGVGTLTIDGDEILGNIAITVTAVVAKADPEVYTVSGTTSVCEGDEATITLSDSDYGVTYHLYKGEDDQDDDKVGDGNEITWTVTAAGTYTVKVEEDEDYNAADMDGNAVISYKTATSIDTDPATAVTGHDGVNFTLGSGMEASGQGTLTYKWYSYTSSGGADKAVVAGATEATYTTSKSAGTYYYKVEVTAACGSVESSMITVTIDNKHKLTYDANGGSGAPEAEFRAAGSAALSATEPTRSNYRFLGWNTEDDGTGDHYDAGASYTMGTSAVTLYAEWGETATLTWTLTTGTGESSVSTSEKNSTNGTRIAKSNMSNLLNNGLTITNNSKSDYTVKIEAPATKNNDKYMYVTFVVADNYELVPSAVTATFQPVDAAASADMILSDTHGHSISLLGASCSKGKGNEKTITNGSGVAFSGTVTLKIYCYGSSVNTYRLGSTITITGDINYVCPERPTITSPTAPQSIKLYTDQSKALSVSATAYAGTLNYQWQKDGVDIDGATSATYTVVGSGLTAGTTYVYTCNVSETSPASCATVTSPAVTIKAASTDCGYTEFASAVLTSKSAATLNNATLLVNGLADISSGSCKLNGKGAYFGLQLASGSFQVGDSIEFKIKQNNSTDIYLFATTDTTGLQTTDAIYTQSVTSGDNIIKFVVTSGSMLTALNTSKKVAVVRRTKDGVLNQNHSVYYAKVKRYGCPDIYVYDDAADNGVWSDEDNWIGSTGHGSGLPTIDDRAIITKPITVDIAHATAAAVILDQSDSKTGQLEIAATGGLVVATTVQKTTNGSTYVDTEVNDIVINTSSSGNGALVMKEYTGGNSATVNFYTKAYKDATYGWINQFIASPFNDAGNYMNYYGSYLYMFDAESQAWVNQKSNSKSIPFAAYNLLRKDATATTLWMQGELVSNENYECDLYYNGSSNTENMIGNSWTAPISIAALSDAFTNCDATVYIFNAGSASQVAVAGSAAQGANSPGQYIAVPVNSAEWAEPTVTVIPSMQAFSVYATKASPSVSLNYNTHVYTPATSSLPTTATRAPRRVAANNKPDIMRLRVVGMSGYADVVHMLMREDWTSGFENGYDARKMEGVAEAPQMYAVTEAGKMTVNCIDEAEGTVIGFRAGQDNTYTFYFNYDGEDIWYLNDLKEEKSTLIDAANTYSFTAETGDAETRFVISATPIQKVPTGIDNGGLMNDGMVKVRKLIINDKVYIIRGGRMYSVDGAIVK